MFKTGSIFKNTIFILDVYSSNKYTLSLPRWIVLWKRKTDTDLDEERRAFHESRSATVNSFPKHVIFLL